MFYTLGQAAKATGKTKTTIQVAIKNGRLSASKDDLGRYQIDPAELHRVYPLVANEPSGLNEASPQKDPEIQSQFDRLDRMIAFLQSQLEAKDEHIKSLTLRLSAPMSSAIPMPSPEAVEDEPEDDDLPEPEITLAPAPNRVSILERIFGRKAA